MKTVRIIFDTTSDPENPGWFARYHDDSPNSRVIQEDWALSFEDQEESEKTLKSYAKIQAPALFFDNWDEVKITIERNVKVLKMTTLREKLVNKAINRAKLNHEHEGPCTSLACEEVKDGNIRLYDDWESIILNFEQALKALGQAEHAANTDGNPYEVFWSMATAYGQNSK